MPNAVNNVKKDSQAVPKDAAAFVERSTRRKNPVAQKTTDDLEALKDICCSLIRIAQEYVPTTPSAFNAFSEIVRCTKMLQQMGVNPEVAAKFNAVVGATGSEIIRHSAEYRYLRNTAIAGFATIVDLAERPEITGLPDFQNGVRSGYRRASNIAMRFLADIEGGD